MRDKQYLDMVNQWLILKQEGKGLETCLRKMGYGSIAVYGMGLYGRHVIRELQTGNVSVAYGIDRRELTPYKGITIYQPMKQLPHADVIVNTIIYDHVNVQKTLAEITDISVISLEDIVFESYQV